jgi:hypothetical protein|tara:strand:- start:501 stop:881 length:381 start_codon:yes stop_codon:yes gene_type:complete
LLYSGEINQGDIMAISKEIYSAPSLKDDIKVASESAAEEAQLELDQLLQQFDEWKKDNKGGWRDFLKDNKDETKVKRINLKDGGNGESSFAQLADDYEDDIQVVYIDGVKEDFGSYVKRMGGIKDE